MNNPERIKFALSQSIASLCQAPNDFVKNPGTDFTRNRKLPLENTIYAILRLGNKSLPNEMLDMFKCSVDMPSVSAFVQQREKIKSSAFKTILSDFNSRTQFNNLYKGYRLLAVDGSSLQIFTNPYDSDTYFPNNGKPFNMLHINALYDLLSHTYSDAIVQTGHQANESVAFTAMIDNFDSHGKPAIFTADRGFESYNNLAHVQEKGLNFLIRIKDAHSQHGIASTLSLPDGSFDKSFNLLLTRKQTKETKELFKNKDNYKYISASTVFDYLPQKSRKNDPAVFYSLSFRIVRFKISDDSYETVITNLDSNDFPAQEIEKIYAMRWGIETSFRDLKYTIGLLHLHSKKVELICQEIYAAIIMYNFSELITSHVAIQQCGKRYHYQVNFSSAANICKKFLFGIIDSINVETLIAKFLLPVRKNRKYIRNMSVKPSMSFLYRMA